MRPTDSSPPNSDLDAARRGRPDLPPPTQHSDLDLFVCPLCGLLHPKKLMLTTAEVAFLSSYTKASIHTFHSRGGILPKPAMNGRGNPRWSACSVARWLNGTLPSNEIEPKRGTRG